MEPGNVLSTDHSSVHHPDPIHFAKPILHTLDNLLDRGDIGGVARKKLIAQWHPFPTHHQRDIDLHTIGPMIATISALG